jgi:hypothetical protein
VIKRDVAVEYTRINVPWVVLTTSVWELKCVENEIIKLQFQRQSPVNLLEGRLL